MRGRLRRDSAAVVRLASEVYSPICDCRGAAEKILTVTLQEANFGVGGWVWGVWLGPVSEGGWVGGSSLLKSPPYLPSKGGWVDNEPNAVGIGSYGLEKKGSVVS